MIWELVPNAAWKGLGEMDGGWKRWMEAAPGGVDSGALEEGAWGRVGKLWVSCLFSCF